MYSFWGGVRMGWYALRRCDDHAHDECRDGHELRPEEEEWVTTPNGVQIRSGPKTCKTCGAEIVHRPSRKTMLRLARGQLRRSLWVTWYQESPTDRTHVRRTYVWRGHRLRERTVARSAS